ncbi:hypothetical protein O181_050779 [Austropuccinia psidii MF-1]|uniref:Chromo domain-containing protein n=1 Tax=Austropuccinia psidii MF-1 TaxID=1389203 RepID=A0A9Q3DXH3_9BASI|nr:hypothetical protein [Austropuccinia psidii MF-1]
MVDVSIWLCNLGVPMLLLLSKILQACHFTRCLVKLGQHVPREGGGIHQQESSGISSSKHTRWISRVKIEIYLDLVDQIQKEVWQDKEYKEILKQLTRDSPAGNLSKKIQSVQKVVKEELESAIRRCKKYAHRSRTIPPDFQPGDKVLLSSKNIKTTRPTKKHSKRWLCLFEVLKKAGSHAYHLKLPLQWNSVHPVFHVSLLEPVNKSSIPNQNQLPPPPILVEEKEEWEVDQVLDSNLKRGKLWYLVEWKGFSEDPERTNWKPASNLTNSPELVKDFHSLYPEKPGPNTSRV